MTVGRRSRSYGGTQGISELTIGRGSRSYGGARGDWLGCASRIERFELEASRSGLSVLIRSIATGGIDGVWRDPALPATQYSGKLPIGGTMLSFPREVGF